MFLRAPRSHLFDNSSIFLHYPNTRATESALLETQRPESLSDVFFHTLLEFASDNQNKDCLILATILPYINNLASCCRAYYYRLISLEKLEPSHFDNLDDDLLFNEMQQIILFQREVEEFCGIFSKGHVTPYSLTSQSQATCRVLRELTKDLKRFSSFVRAVGSVNDSNHLGGLMQALTTEAEEARKTSRKLGYLTQTAYIFLPLQLTATIMGMNLEKFGTGNIDFATFSIALVTIATLSFVLVFIQSEVRFDRISQIRVIAKHSRRAATLYGMFCLFHSKTINDELWESGIKYDLDFFKGVCSKRQIGGDGWVRTRAGVYAALRSHFLSFFPRYWERVLDELFSIIDSPQWKKKDNTHHIA